MAYIMSIQGAGFDRAGWLSELKSTYIEDPESVRTPLSGLFHQVVDVEDIGGEQLWLHPQDGIRGVTVWQRDGRVELSLPTGVSETDFILAGDLLRMGIRHGGEASAEEHGPLQATDEEISEISRKIRGFNYSSLRGMAGQGYQESTLPVGGFLHLRISAAEMGNSVEELERALVERMRRYSAAYVPSQMMVRSQDGQTFTLSNYGHMPSLIDAETELIATQGDGGPICPEPIPAAHFFSVLGDRIENLGKFLYIPGIDFNSEPALADALRSHAPQAPARSQELTGDDWALLAKAPCLVFLMVAAADGSVDKKEMALFGALLQKHADVPLPVFSKVLKIAFSNLEHMVTELLQSDVPTLVQLIAVRALLDSGKFRPEESADIAKGLYALGRAVASASGGFMGFGSKISKKEAEVLDIIEKLLLK